ncbi:protein phosphatase 1 regulatory subunit 12C-like isoform X17 [Phaenicophaeus curvirostris]|uniref:protein phosphatase 1 regulatory subunit 12C-like isoform X17 n=1 Tax=Phaenicophaeus curvirostris TaxID=33595 RepID=UPI0037F0F1E2
MGLGDLWVWGCGSGLPDSPVRRPPTRTRSRCWGRERGPGPPQRCDPRCGRGLRSQKEPEREGSEKQRISPWLLPPLNPEKMGVTETPPKWELPPGPAPPETPTTPHEAPGRRRRGGKTPTPNPKAAGGDRGEEPEPRARRAKRTHPPPASPSPTAATAPPPRPPSPPPAFDYEKPPECPLPPPKRPPRAPQLYEVLWGENTRLREQLQETELKLSQSRLELERLTQRQERIAERPALLELERFERRALELKAAELEEELKRLRDENAALIRVVSKLAK